jgi:hypothetical protein
MNRVLQFLTILLFIAGCTGKNKEESRLQVAKVGNHILYFDQVPIVIQKGTSPADSAAIIQNYIKNWSKKEILYLKAEENLSADNKNEIENQLRDTRANLFIYQYQRQMMVEKMDTTVSDKDMETYYDSNKNKFSLSSNIIKALFIKVPVDAPSIDRIRLLSRSASQADMQQLESLCFQFAESFDDFDEDWVTMDQLCVELPQDIPDKEGFLRYNTWYETRDTSSVYLVTIRDYRLRNSLAPYEFVMNDIRNIILNNRRFEFLQQLENDIYTEGIKSNLFKQF